MANHGLEDPDPDVTWKLKSHVELFSGWKADLEEVPKWKTVNNMNSGYTRDTFIPKSCAKIRPHDIIVSDHITAHHSDKSLKALGPKFWNQYPSNIKVKTYFTKFKDYIQNIVQP